MAKSGMTVRVEDNSGKVFSAFLEQVELGLAMIGEIAEGYAKEDCPVGSPESTGIPGYVGGRLRNSLTYATSIKDGGGDGPPATPSDSKPHGKPKKGEVYIGTNVEYARYVEYRDNVKHLVGKAHFIRDAVVNHSREYADAMQAALETE